MNKPDLYNYIKLCKTCDLNTINNIYNDLTTKSNDTIHNEYGIPFEYINSIKILSNNGKNYNLLQDIYNDYHTMIGGKGGKTKGTKGRRNHSQLQKQLKKKINKEVKKQVNKQINKKYKETKDETVLSENNTFGLATGLTQPNTSGIISDITILKSKIDEIYKNKIIKFTKNNYALKKIKNDINNINNKIDLITTQLKKE